MMASSLAFPNFSLLTYIMNIAINIYHIGLLLGLNEEIHMKYPTHGKPSIDILSTSLSLCVLDTDHLLHEL